MEICVGAIVVWAVLGLLGLGLFRHEIGQAMQEPSDPPQPHPDPLLKGEGVQGGER